MYSHPLKPVKQLSGQTTQDAASQNYKTHWNYFHSDHNNNVPGQDLQGTKGRDGGGSSAPHRRPRCCPPCQARRRQHPRSARSPRPAVASSAPPARANPLAGAGFWQRSVSPPKRALRVPSSAPLELLDPDMSRPARGVSLLAALNQASASGAEDRRGGWKLGADPLRLSFTHGSAPSSSPATKRDLPSNPLPSRYLSICTATIRCGLPER